MRSWMLGMTVVGVSLAACDGDWLVVSDEPDAPRDLEGYYYDGAVNLSWRLGARWNGEFFRLYSKRESDPEYFFIAEVTSCTDGVCVYRDVNVSPGVTYEYYVAAVDIDLGLETATEYSIEVFVPRPVPPAVPESVEAVALDHASYVRWSNEPALEDDFAAYRVYLSDSEGDYLLGETDSPGFIDLLADNGRTWTYFVTSVDDQGHESDGSEAVSCTPRPDYTGEVLYTFQDVPTSAGFRFQESDDLEAVMAGDSEFRHFRLEADAAGLWLVPGPGARIHPDTRWTTALKCGAGADSDCVSWELAPMSGYSSRRAPLDPGLTYMLRVPGDDGDTRFGAVRASLAGVDQDGYELIVFDWAYQTQAGNPNLDGAVGTNGW